MAKVIASIFEFVINIFVSAKEENVLAFNNIKSGDGKLEDYVTPVYILAGFVTAFGLLSIPVLMLTGVITGK